MSGSPIYLLSGMTPDARIFEQLLPFLPNSTVIEWIPPRARERLPDYAARLAGTLPNDECHLVGVSFGGIVALELARLICPRTCFLISSVRHPNQLPPWFGIWRSMAGWHSERMLAAVGRAAIAIPRHIRTRSTTRLTKLAGAKGAWHRWATGAVLTWQPECEPLETPVYQIHGDADRTFPIRYLHPDVIVQGGGHLLALTHPRTVADAILSRIAG